DRSEFFASSLKSKQPSRYPAPPSLIPFQTLRSFFSRSPFERERRLIVELYSGPQRDRQSVSCVLRSLPRNPKLLEKKQQFPSPDLLESEAHRNGASNRKRRDFLIYAIRGKTL